MNVSSHSLFHYTKKFENLFGIISGGFHFSRNTDQLPLRGLGTDLATDMAIGLTPISHDWRSHIICFCDIPLSASADHRTQYGDYVLGLSKEWAKSKGVTPLRYIHFDSPDFRSRYPDWILALDQLHDKHESDVVAMVLASWKDSIIPAPAKAELEQLSVSVRRLIFELQELVKSLLYPAVNNFHLMKVHRGTWKDRTTDQTTERQFYDEREWRAIGKPGDCLRFAPSDLTFVIVKTEAERKLLLEQINAADPEMPLEEQFRTYAKIRTWDELLRDH